MPVAISKKTETHKQREKALSILHLFRKPVGPRGFNQKAQKGEGEMDNDVFN